MSTSDIAEKIMDIAEDFIKERGYNAFSYRDLSKEVGIKTSSIHYHFPTKGDLAKKIAERYKSNLMNAIKLIDESTEDPREKLVKYIHIFYEIVKTGDKICFCAMMAADYSNLPDEVKDEVNSLFIENEKWLTKVLKTGLKTGAFNFKGKPEDKATAIFSSLEGATISSRAFSDIKRVSWVEEMILSSLESK